MKTKILMLWLPLLLVMVAVAGTPSRYTDASRSVVELLDRSCEAKNVCRTGTVGVLFSGCLKSLGVPYAIDERLQKLPMPRAKENYDLLLNEVCCVRIIVTYLEFLGLEIGKDYFVDVREGTLILTNSMARERLVVPLTPAERSLIVETNGFEEGLTAWLWNKGASVRKGDAGIVVEGYGLDLLLLHDAIRDFVVMTNRLEGTDMTNVFRTIMTNALCVEIGLLNGEQAGNPFATVTDPGELRKLGQLFSVYAAREFPLAVEDDMQIVIVSRDGGRIVMGIADNLAWSSCWSFSHRIDKAFINAARRIASD